VKRGAKRSKEAIKGEEKSYFKQVRSAWAVNMLQQDIITKATQQTGYVYIKINSKIHYSHKRICNKRHLEVNFKIEVVNSTINHIVISGYKITPHAGSQQFTNIITNILPNINTNISY